MRNRIAVGCLVVFLWYAVAWAAPTPLREVRVRGNLRVEAGLILNQVNSRAGEPYAPRTVRGDIRAIYALGYFDEIAVELEEGVLTFVVLERPSLREWSSEGADRVDPEDLKQAVTLERRKILDRAALEASRKAILGLYRKKGYYLAEVDPVVEPVEGGKNQVDVVFRVREGEKVRLKAVNLLGVQGVDEDHLRSFLGSQPSGPWSGLTGGGTFDPGDLARDREVIQAYYLNHGYAEVEVLDPLISLSRDRRWIRVDLPVREGDEFHYGKIGFTGDLEFEEDVLRQAVGIETGGLFKSDDLRRAHGAITDLYADEGYAFADVNPKTGIDRDAGTMDIDFDVNKGSLVHIGRVEVRGNTKTRDRVVRREVRLAEGDRYSSTAIRKTRQALGRLGYFEKVNLSTHRRPGTDLVDVDVEIEEKPTGSFSAGAGYSSVDKIVGMLSVSQRNLFGYGYQLSLQANFGSTKQTYNLTFNNPRVFDSNVYAGMDLFNTSRTYTEYDKDSMGGAGKLGMSLSDEWKVRSVYRWERDKVKNASDGASIIIQDQVGTTTTSSITGLLIYDSLDNPFEPHEGSKAQASVEWADHYFGGDIAFLKYDLDASKHFGLWWDTVLTFHGRLGFIQGLHNDPIPIYDRYVLGGINSLRGFDYRSVGPKDPVTGDVLGGDKQLLFNVEYTFPLVPEAKVRGVVFYDTGNAWDEGEPYLITELRNSTGAGVRWNSPMGPLRLEWGYNLEPKPDETRSQWEFSIGGFF